MDYLCAADVGLLLREKHLMNEVASPGKFAEYALSGLPIIMTSSAGEWTEYVRNSRFIAIIPDLCDNRAVAETIQSFCLAEFTNEDRKGFSEWAADRLSTEALVSELARLYKTI